VWCFLFEKGALSLVAIFHNCAQKRSWSKIVQYSCLAVANRAGIEVRCEKTGELFNYANKKKVDCVHCCFLIEVS